MLAYNSEPPYDTGTNRPFASVIVQQKNEYKVSLLRTPRHHRNPGRKARPGLQWAVLRRPTLYIRYPHTRTGRLFKVSNRKSDPAHLFTDSRMLIEVTSQKYSRITRYLFPTRSGLSGLLGVVLGFLISRLTFI